MATIGTILEALDERNIAQAIGIPHDEARLSYRLHSNTISSFDAFTEIIGEYVQHHSSRCIAAGGRLSRSEAAGRAKEILERAYGRRNGDLITAYNDAHDGTNGGLRQVLDTIAEALKAEAVERYVRDVFDRCVAPNAWEEKVRLVEEFLGRYGPSLGSSVQLGRPERYAQSYKELIRSYVEALQRTSSVFRRL